MGKLDKAGTACIKIEDQLNLLFDDEVTFLLMQ